MKTKKSKYTWRSLGFYRDRCNNLVELKVCEKKKSDPEEDGNWKVIAILSMIANVILIAGLIIINNS